MASRFQTPKEQFVDSAGLPYVGAQLFFYQAGTSTKLDTYTNAGLTIANPNPIVLNALGEPDNAVFLQTQQYKVVLAPSTDTDPPTSPIWTQDPVYTPDYSTAAQFTSGNGSPNGSVAGTAGSATIKASAYWDFTNNILYICTTTGTTTTAVWTAVNASSAAAVVPTPQGYLTPVSGTPIIINDTSAATTVYYTPYTGLLVPIYNGASFIPTSIATELQLTLVSSHTANNIYDFYIFSLNGVPTLGTGPSWSAGSAGSITAGACARGTGTGGSAITRVSGLWTNTVSMTMRYGTGTTTTTVAANQGTYVGSLLVDPTNGQVTCNRAYGQSRRWGLWNAYNRVPIILKAGDGTSSWNYGSTIRPSNNSTANSLSVFSGLAEEEYAVNFSQAVLFSNTNFQVGIGWNSTSSASGFAPTLANGTANNFTSIGQATYLAAPSLGVNVATSLETAGSTSTFNGTETKMLLSATWRG